MDFSPDNGNWQDLSDSKKFNYIYENEYLVDCEFVVGPDDKTAKTIKGHRLIFIMASPVFEKMLTGDFTEAKKNSKIRINDVYAMDFENLCNMIYNNCSELSSFTLEEIFVLYRLSDKYLISSIAKKCIEKVRTSINNANVETILAIYKFALGLDDKKLITEVKNALKTKQGITDDKLLDFSEHEFYEYILNRYQTDSAVKTFATVNTYLIRNKLFAPEDGNNESLKASLDNSATDNKTLRSRLLNLINFNLMSLVEFINGPGKSRLLNEVQKYDMLSKLVQHINIENNF